MDDLISKQAAIDGFYNVKVDETYCTEYDIGYNDGIDYAISKLSVMPSAQLEPLTDKEQRIFLAAMRRETKVCEAVDKEMDEEFPVPYAYDVSLVSVCREIERKVKKALWTN